MKKLRVAKSPSERIRLGFAMVLQGIRVIHLSQQFVMCSRSNICLLCVIRHKKRGWGDVNPQPLFSNADYSRTQIAPAALPPFVPLVHLFFVSCQLCLSLALPVSSDDRATP